MPRSPAETAAPSTARRRTAAPRTAMPRWSWTPRPTPHPTPTPTHNRILAPRKSTRVTRVLPTGATSTVAMRLWIAERMGGPTAVAMPWWTGARTPRRMPARVRSCAGSTPMATATHRGQPPRKTCVRSNAPRATPPVSPRSLYSTVDPPIRSSTPRPWTCATTGTRIATVQRMRAPPATASSPTEPRCAALGCAASAPAIAALTTATATRTTVANSNSMR